MSEPTFGYKVYHPRDGSASEGLIRALLTPHLDPPLKGAGPPIPTLEDRVNRMEQVLARILERLGEQEVTELKTTGGESQE